MKVQNYWVFLYQRFQNFISTVEITLFQIEHRFGVGDGGLLWEFLLSLSEDLFGFLDVAELDVELGEFGEGEVILLVDFYAVSEDTLSLLGLLLEEVHGG